LRYGITSWISSYRNNPIRRARSARRRWHSVAIAANAPFSEWNHTFTEPRLCSAVVDRLTYNAHIIETGSESYRLKTTTQRR
jgi:DNA replication protein DnaC